MNSIEALGQPFSRREGFLLGLDEFKRSATEELPMADESSPESRTQPAHPLRRDIRSLGMWKYLVNYILLGASALLIVMEIIESGAWRDLGVPLLLLLMAIGNLARLQAAECKQVEPAAAPDRRGM